MTKFELYEKRCYRRIALQDHDGVYCVISGSIFKNKAVTVSAAEFSQKGFKFSVSPEMNIDFTQDHKLSLKAIVGSRNRIFTEPIEFEAKWQDLDIERNRVLVGCEICKITTESEEQFVSFIRHELNFAGQWIKDQQQGLPIRDDAEPRGDQSLESPIDKDGRFENLFNNNHTVMLLINPENADIVDANKAAVAYYGWSYGDLTCKKITDINTLTQEQVFKEMEEAIKERRQHFCFQHRLANGGTRDVEVFSGPVCYCGRQILYSIIHDITDRNQVEAEREKLILEQQKALEEIKILRSILTICSFCKKLLSLMDTGKRWMFTSINISMLISVTVYAQNVPRVITLTL